MTSRQWTIRQKIIAIDTPLGAGLEASINFTRGRIEIN
jgi:hypothetical protein